MDTTWYHPYPNGQLKGKTIFTFIGRLLYDKGIREFVEAARLIKKQRKDVEFWIVGELDAENPATIDKDDLVRWVEEDVVYYHGFIKDVRNIIASQIVLCCRQIGKDYTRIVIEGMSMAKPVITTKTAGCSETVDEGINGYLVDIKSVSALTNAVNQFQHKPRTTTDYGLGR
ncbi:MAG: glycosyltransferase [Saprospiraceae bacterium]|nr:glycosyltransferase [Saprospiraceae bacterium]